MPKTGTASDSCERSQSWAVQGPRMAIVCAECGIECHPKHPRGRFCRDACRAKHQRREIKAQLEAAKSPQAVLFPVEAPANPQDARLSRQCDRILALLERGPVTNRALAAISLKYTGRISELRERGYRIAVISQDRKTGLTTYALTEASDELL